jgi:hypothetical protein
LQVINDLLFRYLSNPGFDTLILIIKNQDIAGGMDNLYSLYDANWRLDGNLLRPTFFWRLRRPTHKFVSSHILRRQHQP